MENMPSVTRNGNFSSSQIYRLTNPIKAKRKMTAEELAARPKLGTGSRITTVEYDDYSQLDSVALNYIKDKVREVKLNRPITNRASTFPIIWGNILEVYVMAEKLKLNYIDGNNMGRRVHPEIERWTGIPDFIKMNGKRPEIVSDLKCQTSLTAFCDLHDDTVDVQTFKENHKDHYWQLVSNAILTGLDKAELIWYVPEISELPKILNWIDEEYKQWDDDVIPVWERHRVSQAINEFINTGVEPSFAYLPNGCKYKSFNTFEFDIPQEDKDLLTARVKMAVEELEKQLGQ